MARTRQKSTLITEAKAGSIGDTAGLDSLYKQAFKYRIQVYSATPPVLPAEVAQRKIFEKSIAFGSGSVGREPLAFVERVEEAMIEAFYA